MAAVFEGAATTTSTMAAAARIGQALETGAEDLEAKAAVGVRTVLREPVIPVGKWVITSATALQRSKRTSCLLYTSPSPRDS